MSNGGFRFEKHDQIGAAAAEEDHEYLSQCFVDTGDLALLEDVGDRRQIVLGRTGSGKTALLAVLKSRNGDDVIEVSPASLALTYVSNSTILRFFSDIGVNLDPFFRLLWRHVLTVEILTRYFRTHAVPSQSSLLDMLRSLFTGSSRRDKEMKEAIHYLEAWGKEFWLETEFRVKEITQKLESDLRDQVTAQLGIPSAKVAAAISSGEKLTTEQSGELQERGQKIVSSAQVQDLNKVVALLDNVLSDRQKQYYLVIDGLDEDWVEEKLRHSLIMSLIHTARELGRVKSAKVIIALRRDLIERVFRLCRGSGFQEEKFRSLFVPLSWPREYLVELLDRRIDALVKRRYTKRAVTHRDLLPREYRRVPITDFVVARAPRPRDVIAFFNTCISCATGQGRLSSKELKLAEGEYSRTRFRALGDEWSADYPALLDFAMILSGRPPSFKVAQIELKDIEELSLKIAAEQHPATGILQQCAAKTVEQLISPEEMRLLLIRAFYRVGLVGLKLQPHEKASWVDELGQGYSAAEVGESASVVVHPTFHRALGIRDR